MYIRRQFHEPDETVAFGGVTEQLISVSDLTISRSVQPVGWSWEEHFKPLVGGEWCEAHHVGVQIEGRQAIRLTDGTVHEFGPGDVYDMPPGHVGWTVGNQESVAIEWSGMRQWIGGARPTRVLASLLFTDIVSSTEVASQVGDATWHDLLSIHYHWLGEVVESGGGRRVATTGDGMLAAFDATAAAVRCAIRVRDTARGQDLHVRVGVHVGEVEMAGDDLRGVTVHEAARVMSEAGTGEILVSEVVRSLCSGSDFVFEDTGEHQLKGVNGPWRLYRVGRAVPSVHGQADVNTAPLGSGHVDRTTRWS